MFLTIKSFLPKPSKWSMFTHRLERIREEKVFQDYSSFSGTFYFFSSFGWLQKLVTTFPGFPGHNTNIQKCIQCLILNPNKLCSANNKGDFNMNINLYLTCQFASEDHDACTVQPSVKHILILNFLHSTWLKHESKLWINKTLLPWQRPLEDVL